MRKFHQFLSFFFDRVLSFDFIFNFIRETSFVYISVCFPAHQSLSEKGTLCVQLLLEFLSDQFEILQML